MGDVLDRGAVLQRLAGTLDALQPGQVPRVAVDGPDAAGKTTLAGELAGLLSAHRTVIRASIDGWHHPAERRYQRGSESAEGYYLDSFDHEALIRGSAGEVRRRYTRRYLPGQDLYRRRDDPLGRADVVLDMTDPARPVMRR